jgi:hypothetical protein
MVFIDPTVQTHNGDAYVQRHYEIEPATNANTATAAVTLYFTQADFDAYNAAVSASASKLPTGPTNTAGIANVRVNQFHGTPSGGYAPSNYPNTWGGAGPAHVLINPADAAVVYNTADERWEITFDVTGFSGFFLSAGNDNPLPLELLSFTAQKTGGIANRLAWQVASEDPGTVFGVARSSDGASFKAIGSVAGKGANSAYAFYDEQPLEGVNYYRLQIAAPGEVSFSNIAVVRNSSNGGSVTVAPVPASDKVIITNTDEALYGTTATILDMQGREMARFVLAASQSVDISGYAAGVYSLKLDGGTVVRIVKK